jgi:carnitine 3-dehydrogenase
VKLGTTVAVRIQVLGVREKKLHLWYSMTDGENGPEAATMESMWLFYDGKAAKVSAIASEVRRRIDEMVAAQGDRPMPEGAGRHIAL